MSPENAETIWKICTFKIPGFICSKAKNAKEYMSTSSPRYVLFIFLNSFAGRTPGYPGLFENSSFGP